MPVLAAREATWLASRQSRSAPRRQQAQALAATTGANGWELLQWGWHEVTVDNALAHAEACCGAETGTHDGRFYLQGVNYPI